MWPVIAGRRIALNFRWAQPDGVLELYQAGSEGPQWWGPYPDRARKLPTRSIQDRCMATKTCPKIIEHFGAAEIWALKLGPEWVGTDPKEDIPLPDNVRRYYVASSTHGGGSGGFNASLAEYHKSAKAVQLPRQQLGHCGTLPANPLSHDEPWRALTVHFRNWVMNNTAPPPSRLSDHQGRPARRTGQDGDGFPDAAGPARHRTGTRPDQPAARLRLGPAVRSQRRLGHTRQRAAENQTDAAHAGAESECRRQRNRRHPRGAARSAAGHLPRLEHHRRRPFHAGQLCNYAGGMVPFASTKAEREANNDPRPSLEERYGSHAGFVDAVRKAADKVKAAGFLLEKDAAALVKQAEASNVLK